MSDRRMPPEEELDRNLLSAAQALLAKRELALLALCSAAETVFVNAWDIDGVPDRASVSYEHLGLLTAAVAQAKRT
jgi:hypothetical protein